MTEMPEHSTRTKEWIFYDEKIFIDTMHERHMKRKLSLKLPEIELLRRYKKALLMRERWGMLHREEVLAYLNEKIAKLKAAAC